jgi:hypothetical protein
MKMIRTLMGGLFDKSARLSMKSLTATDSGKLISLVSADLFIAEDCCIGPTLIAAPFINLLACYFLSITVGIQYTGIVFGSWLIIMVLQYYSTLLVRKWKGEESGINDERLKLVNDMVVGCRTIKCYGWE